MLLKGLGIANYKSFDTTGVLLDKVKKINLIIGKNNSGKSNVLEFLRLTNKYVNHYRGTKLKINISKGRC